ncbi:SLBB domain-containing protein [Niveispirillum sp.]|uniref:SLBB domain-containing protein n=1 Tax=Niveispirillum sp. TaxID=1917217 RepID=UPI001B72C0FF|nr:SLBB domain-containing protein [Niveispirillum sp.]MBP7336993.1 SLBB domain-containing protein [Niveispirillum sp.]
MPGRVERLFSDRAGQELRLFGRDLFAGGAAAADGPALGSVGDDYRLGPGDELSLLLRGQAARNSRHRIGADGLLLVDDLRPIAAAGRTLGEVRAELEAAVAATHVQTQAFLSLLSMRRVGILVLGQVAKPGRVALPAFATPLDALLAAGGVLPDGSLRAIRLVPPGGGGGVLVDLYDLLTRGDGAAADLLADGARLIVPPLGPVVAVAGSVKRPGIYELPPGAGSGTGPDDTADLLALAGGALRPGRDRSSLLRLSPEGVERPLPVSAGTPIPLRDGDLLIHAPEGGARAGGVTLSGAVAEPGERVLVAGMRLADLVDRSMLPPDAWLPAAVLLRRTAAGGSPQMRALDLAALLSGREAEMAVDGDRLVVLSAADVGFLRGRSVLSLLAGQPADPLHREECAGLASLAAALSADPEGALAAGPLARAAIGVEGPPLPCPPLFQGTDGDLLPFLLRQSVFMRRGVLRPGPYPLAGPMALSALAPMAGGGFGGKAQVAPGQVADAVGDGVLLSGPVRQPGLRSVGDDGLSLRALLSGAGAPLPDAYGLAALLERTDATASGRRPSLFAPAEVVEGRFDLRLRDGDRVTLFTRDAVMGTETPDPLDPALRALLSERMVALRGGVVRPGEYPVAGPLPLPLLLRAAGGVKPEGDPARLELLPPPPGPRGEGQGDGRGVAPREITGGVAAVEMIPPGAALRVALRQRPQERRGVLLAGEVAEPGTYDIAPGETLSMLLHRAGGLTDEAYPAGVIFTRESARLAEEEGLRRNARELDRQLSQMLGGKNPPDPARVELVRQLAADLRGTTALGRITVEANPDVLGERPELDIPLQPGDRVHMPRRPLTVTVSGEVLAPASLLFDPEKQAKDYLREAGGLTRFADDDRIFVIQPNGAAQPLESGWLDHEVATVLPGSMIVVPRDAEPFEWLPLTQSITTILSQIAFSAAAIAAISD